MNYKKLLSIFQKNSIEIKLYEQRTRNLKIAKSKFGGCPDLPEHFEWYYYEGEGFNGDIKNRPLSFLAQINLEEAKPYDKDNLLPNRGMLYLFYELETMTWGFDEKDYKSARVYYYDGDLDKLKPRNFPDDLHEDYRLKELLIEFNSKLDMPDYEELDELMDEGQSEELDDYYEEYIKKDDDVEEQNPLHKLLGYANIIQNSMLLECEQITSKLKGNINTEQEDSCESKKWRLLFQMDSDDRMNLMFGDAGTIYFYIKEDDLKNCNFDNIWCILQCY